MSGGADIPFFPPFVCLSSVYPPSFWWERSWPGLDRGAVGSCLAWSVNLWSRSFYDAAACGFRQTKPSKSAWERSMWVRRLFWTICHSVSSQTLAWWNPYGASPLDDEHSAIYFPLSGAAGASKNIGGLSPYWHPSIWCHWPLLPSWSVFQQFGGLTGIGISLERGFTSTWDRSLLISSAISSWSF